MNGTDYPTRPRVEDLRQAVKRVAELLNSEDTIARIEERIGKALKTSYIMEVHWSPKQGLCVELNHHTGQSGQVMFFRQLDGAAPKGKEGA